MRSVLTVLLLLCIGGLTMSQQERIVQLETLMNSEYADTLDEFQKIKNYVTLSYLFQRKSFEKSLDYSLLALKLSRENKNKTGVGMALNMAGTAHSSQGNYDTAMILYNEALDIFKDLSDTNGITITLNNLGIVNKSKGNYATAIKLYKKTYDLAKLKNDKDGMILALNNLGIVYYDWEKYETAIEYYEQAGKLLKEIGDQSRLAVVLNNIGEVYTDLKQYEKALENFRRSLEISKESQASKGIMNSYNNIADIYALLNKPDKSVDFYEKSLKIGVELGDLSSITYSYLKIGEVYLGLSDFDKAKPCLLKGLKKAKELNSLKLLKDACYYTSKLYSSTGDHKKALDLYVKYEQYKDSLFNKDSRKELARLQTEYETVKKEREIDLLTKDMEIKTLELEKQKNQKITIILLSGFLLAIILLLYTRYRFRQKNMQGELLLKNLEIEQRLLRSQMSPHFIFNSLNSISSYIGQNQTGEARQFLAKFSRLIRYILENSRKSMVTIDEEVSTLRLNLELEQMRFDHKFDFDIKVSGEIDAENTYIPPLLIQPFVENAIIHGVSALDERGYIKILFSKQGEHVKCIITDNGIGRMKSKLLKEKTNHHSLGLQVTEERIEILRKNYHTDVKLEITDLIDQKGNSGGTKVELIIPFEED